MSAPKLIYPWFLKTVITVCGLATGTNALAYFLLSRMWVGDCLIAFQHIYLVFAVLGFTFCATLRLRFAATCFACAILFSAAVLSLASGNVEHAIEGQASLTLLSANLLGGQDDYAYVAEFAHEHSPDVLCLQEFTDDAETTLTPLLSKAYPYSIRHSPPNVLGMAIFSKVPLIDPEKMWLSENTYATLSATVELQGEQIRIFNAHTIPPFSLSWYRQRNEELRALESRLEEHNHAVVAGDLNVHIWSRHYADFTAASGMARAGGWPWGTWPLIIGGLGTPIDHVLISHSLASADTSLHYLPKSDHRAIRTRIQLHTN